MPHFSKFFNINKPQALLDFVDIDLEIDTPLYIDPSALAARKDSWSVVSLNQVNTFFQAVITSIYNNDRQRCLELLSHLGEPEETHLGFSKGTNKGSGVGKKQAEGIYDALNQSKASETGLLQDISDLALFIPKLGRDKVSDMTTNIIRHNLIIYTQQQCKLYNIKMERINTGFYWSISGNEWKQGFTELPLYKGKKVLLVPKYTVRYQVGVDASSFRKKFVFDFLQEEHLKAGGSLVKAIKNPEGEVINKIVRKKDLDKEYPKDKVFLTEFSIDNPGVINKYRESLKEKAFNIPNINGDYFDESKLSNKLLADLKAIPTGSKNADIYHNYCVSSISFIFFPNLIYPKKEHQVNEGRKRIDITFVNGKENGIFRRLSLDQSIKANIVHIECKNYTHDINNPEIDQLLSRFDRNRGKFGMLLFRNSKDINKIKSRCKDAAKQGNGIALPIDDNFIIECLEFIANGQRSEIDELITTLYREIIS